MNSLTVNLHLLMASFYRPNGRRRKIAVERHAFPSDRYAVRSHLAFRGVDPDDGLLLLGSNDADTPEEDEIERQLSASSDEIALVLIGGVNYYTGQLFDLPRLCAASHRAGALFGLDLAHAAGNVPLRLHDWDVDFAAWCSYKYLNAGPGAPSGVFIHERHAADPDTPRLAGWWGHAKSSRFEMPDAFEPIRSAEGWQLSNPPILAMAAVKASLSVFGAAGMERLSRKSRSLTGFLFDALERRLADSIDIITPRDVDRRGAQLSIRVRAAAGAPSARSVFERLESRGAVCDWREPDVIRVAPVPLYNTFDDAARFVLLLEEALSP
jgi:kynureninase